MPRRRRVLKEATNIVKEVKELVMAGKELLKELGISVAVDTSDNRVYRGEKIIDNDTVTIVQEVVGEPKVSYDGRSIVINFSDREYIYEVGKIDINSISAICKNNVLTIKARRCLDEDENTGEINSDAEEK